MPNATIADHVVFQGATEVVHVYEPLERDTPTRMRERLAKDMQGYCYRLLDRDLLRQCFEQPIVTHLTRRLPGIEVHILGDQFATQLDVGGHDLESYCFNAMLAGHMAFSQDGHEQRASGVTGAALRVRPGMQARWSDGCCRTNLWIDASLLETALEQMIGDRPRQPLEFRLDVGWDRGLAATLQGQINYLINELGRPDGLASNPVALATFTDLLVKTTLQGLPNSYTDIIVSGRFGALPIYVRRADEYMRQHGAEPIRMADVALAAGCCIRTLEVVYREFRGTTPLNALQGIRLDRVRAELQHPGGQLSIAAIARRYGFTNPARFAKAYRRRFGEKPAQITRQ